MKPESDSPVNIIANIETLAEPEGVPSEHQLEIYRLRRDLTAQRQLLKEKNSKITKALATLQDEVRFFRLGLFEHQWETYSELIHRMVKLESMIALLQDIQPGELPDLKTKWSKEK